MNSSRPKTALSQSIKFKRIRKELLPEVRYLDAGNQSFLHDKDQYLFYCKNF